MSTATIDLSTFDAITFDTYGTLIDWESGILEAARPVLAAHGARCDDERLLELFGGHEVRIEAGPYLRYREVLAGVLRGLGDDLGFTPTPGEQTAFGASVVEWPAFSDSADALARLRATHRLGTITNCDDELFAAAHARLGEPFEWVITAEQARGYKPGLRGLELALERIDLPRDRILHVAQSLFHDHVPAKQLGLTTVWIDRRHGRAGSGATPAVDGAAPDLTLPDVRSLADLAGEAAPATAPR